MNAPASRLHRKGRCGRYMASMMSFLSHLSLGVRIMIETHKMKRNGRGDLVLGAYMRLDSYSCLLLLLLFLLISLRPRLHPLVR